MTGKIAFFLGSDVPASTQTLFTNLTNKISDHFEIDFVGFYGDKRFGDHVNEVIYDYPSHKGINRMYCASRTIKRYDKEHDPDLIFLAHKHTVYSVSLLLSADLSKTIIRINGDTFNLYKDKTWETRVNRAKTYFINNILSPINFKNSLGIVVQTEYMFDEFKKRGFDPEKIKILPLPIDTDRFKEVNQDKKDEIRESLNIDKEKTIALIVGTASKKKRQNLLEKILDSEDSLKDIIFLIIGESVYGKKLDKRYKNVRYEGFVDHDQIHRYYQAGDFLLHFAVNEGLPTVFQEASACNLPIIARKANYNSTLDICRFDTVEELKKMLEDEIWKTADTHVTPGLSKDEYIEFFDNMIERKKQR